MIGIVVLVLSTMVLYYTTAGIQIMILVWSTVDWEIFIVKIFSSEWYMDEN